MNITPDEAKNLLKLGLMCKLSYHDYIPNKVLQLADIEEAILVKDPKMQSQRQHVRAWLMYDKTGEKVHIVFRGTDSLHTALINTHAALVPFDSLNSLNWPGNVHKGYRDTALFAHDLIGRFKAFDGVKEIVMTGHSMGGTCAQIFGAMLKCDGSIADSVGIETVTFGAPPIGDDVFCATFKERIPATRRIVHEYDVVPRLPIPFFKHTHGLKVLRHMPGEVRPGANHANRDVVQYIRYHQMNSYIVPLRKM